MPYIYIYGHNIDFISQLLIYMFLYVTGGGSLYIVDVNYSSGATLAKQ